MDSDENIPDLCRICASPSNETENLFETLHQDVILSEMLKYCLKRSILKEDLLPRNICSNCKCKLIATYEFLNLCETSEKYLLTKYSMQDVNYDAVTLPPCTTLDDNNQSNDVNTVLIKREDDDDDDDFGYKDDSAPASEIICVDEQQFVQGNAMPDMDDNSDLERTSEAPCQLLTYQLRVKQTIEQRIYECFECKKQFQQLQQLRAHMHEHDVSRRPFECVTCNLRFMHINSWFRHRSRHTKNYHNCEYCDAEFNTLTALKRHIQEIHQEHMNCYQCEQCSEKFSLKFLLIWHYEWHKKAKQFVCSTCDAVFFNERKLKAHIRDNHASMFCKFNCLCFAISIHKCF